MKKDIILAGVGGQGVLSIAAIIARAAVSSGFTVRQSEVHGMAQRGGAVLAHLRFSDGPIYADLVPQGGADMIVSMEPLESLRYAAWLSPTGILVSAAEPFVNIPDYPGSVPGGAPGSLPIMEGIYQIIRKFPLFRLVEAAALAKEAGLPKAVNMVMVGAASPFLPLPAETLEETIAAAFARKEPTVGEANIRAFRLGRNASDVPARSA